MLSVQVFGPGGRDRNTAPEYFGSMGVAHGPLRRRHSGKGSASLRGKSRMLFLVSRDHGPARTGAQKILYKGERPPWNVRNNPCPPSKTHAGNHLPKLYSSGLLAKQGKSGLTRQPILSLILEAQHQDQRLQVPLGC
jgi:hypothetical protein